MYRVKSITPTADRDSLVLDEKQLDLIRTFGRRIPYPKGQIIFAAGDIADRAYFIEEGLVKIYRLDHEGRKITVGTIRNQGELMGLAETLCSGERTCFAEAISDVVIVKLTKDDFRQILTKDNELAIKAASLLGVRMREAEAMVHELVCRQVPGRLALLLLKIGERYGVQAKDGTLINLRLTHEEIASMIGATRQTVTQTLNLFKKEKSIDLKGRMIEILDPEKLKQWTTS
ncbi:MAG: Crp/Fnr family transcriptional regulator [Clostridia bacterium]|nr:Crp/Fnr family transcriptional regulator [Clostridia bacterium]MDQ7791502.1 Crp/Fnr family transcriptional regulator [Clostridia bacterium]